MQSQKLARRRLPTSLETDFCAEAERAEYFLGGRPLANDEGPSEAQRLFALPFDNKPLLVLRYHEPRLHLLHDFDLAAVLHGTPVQVSAPLSRG